MNQTIHKHQLYYGINKLHLHTEIIGILNVAFQNEGLFVWMHVNDNNFTRTAQILVVHTGDKIPDDLNLKYIGTAHADGETHYVCHAFFVVDNPKPPTP